MAPDPRATEHMLDLSLLAASLVVQDDETTVQLIGLLREAGVRRESLREVILQTYLHDGYATALEGMQILAREWPGAPEPQDGVPADEDAWSAWRSRGEEQFRRIYGNVADRVNESVRSISPELADWMVVEGYGKVLARPGLEDRVRELATVAVLILKQRPRQLFSHFRGARRVGVDTATLRALISAMNGRLHDVRGTREAHKILDRLEGGASPHP